MGEKIVVGPLTKGLRNDVLPFNIDNDSFPTLINAYQWRGRVKRKRGTQLLNRLERFLGTTDGVGNLIVTISPVPIATGIITVTIGSDIFVDGGGANPVNLTTNSSGTAVLNRTTGVLTITGSQINTAVIYNPTLPVMGIEDLILEINDFPGNLAFDTKYSYNIQTSSPYRIYDVSFYKNPNNGAYPGYTRKTPTTPLNWNGQDYQQFWSVNYQGALWACNGVTVPFSNTNIGMQFKPIVAVTVLTPTTANLQITGHGLSVGDFVYVNEVQTTTGINFQTGYVTTVTDGNNVVVTFPFAILATNGAGGIAQYLTNTADPTKDCIRWYDGDPTNGNPDNPLLNQPFGWVNFAPPLSQSAYPIAVKPAAIYYLVGAKMIVPFKDRLLFLGPVIQTSSANSQIYLEDTVIYSQNGTPYYTASYTNVPNAAIDNPVNPDINFHPILVPINQTATAPAYFEDNAGFGGFVTAGIDQVISTCSANEDALIVGFTTSQTRLVYTGNDIVPFNFFIINSELGSTSTFSFINMDQGILSKGSRGYIITNQTSAQRIDLDIPDQVFETNLLSNGTERVTAQRDYQSEWIYFTYPSNVFADTNKFPSRTLLYNYRDQSWAIFNECFTTYGTFRKLTGDTWATIGNTFPTWEVWDEPWETGETTLLNPQVIGGNQQGFILIKNVGTGEGKSIPIQALSGATLTSPNHGLNDGDYIVISDALGSIGTSVNGKIFSVLVADANTLTLNPSTISGTYQGGGLITRMYVPQIQTKQFPLAWDLGRKTRIGVQQYLLSTTQNSQITLLIFLSQNSAEPYNDSPIVPNTHSINDSLIYSTILYTCPESTNLGLSPANTNLQMPTAAQQQQIWHRINTSLLGDTVQVGFTLSDAQMRSTNDAGIPVNQFAEIELHGMILDVSPSQLLA